jgi:endonuclease G
MRYALAIFLFTIGFPSSVWADNANDIAPCKHMYAEIGMPYHRGDANAGQHSLVCRQGYILSHNNKTRVPDWVLQELPDTQLSDVAERKNNFKPDGDLSPEDRAELDDYLNSGFDRGHQAPSEDFGASQDMMDESFFLSNMAPQVGAGFNNGIWKVLEEKVRDWVKSRNRLIIITGPVYDAPDIHTPEVPAIPKPRPALTDEQEERVSVPAAFYKIVYDPGHGRALAFLFPNTRLIKRKPGEEEFRTSIADIEERTGIDFFRKLTKRRQRTLESNVSPMWEH